MNENFNVYLRRNQKEFFSIDGDGNCLFRAFAQHRLKNQDRWQFIKDEEIDLFTGVRKPFSPGLQTELQADTSAAYIHARNAFASDGYNGTDTDAYILAKLFKYRLVFVYVERYSPHSRFEISLDKRVVTSEYRVADNDTLDKYFKFNEFKTMQNQIFILYSTGHYDLLVSAPGPVRRLWFDFAPITRIFFGEGEVEEAQRKFGSLIQTSEDAVLFNYFDAQMRE